MPGDEAPRNGSASHPSTEQVSKWPETSQQCLVGLIMRPGATAAWCKLCDHPFAICSCYFAAAASYLTAFSVLFFGGYPFPTWPVLITQSVLLVAGTLHAAGMWHSGPDFAGTSVSGTLTLLLVLTTCFLSIWASVGPVSWVPYSNRLISVLILAWAIFCINLTSACGAVSTHHPDSPHPNLRKPLWTSGVDAVRAIDSLTDLTLARIFLDQVNEGCVWFGVGGRCGTLRLLSAIGASLAVAKLLRHSLLHFLGGRVSRDSRSGRWVILGGYVLNLVCECGITVLALLHIFSASNSSGLSSQRVRQRVAVTVLSFALSTAMFALSLAGGLQLVQQMCRATASRTQRSYLRLLRSRSRTSPAQVQPAPLAAPASGSAPILHGPSAHVSSAGSGPPSCMYNVPTSAPPSGFASPPITTAASAATLASRGSAALPTSSAEAGDEPLRRPSTVFAIVDVTAEAEA